MLTIRKATSGDAKVLRDLYDGHLTSRPLQSAKEPPDIEAWEEKLARLNANPKGSSTLSFYESCGFNKDDKTAFIKWL